MSVVTQLLCLCLFIYALIDCFWQNKHSHPWSLSNYMFTQTANTAIDGQDDVLQLKLSGRMGKERQRRPIGVGRPVSENLRNCWSVSTRNRLCGFFFKGMVQIRENQVLHKTPPTLRRMSYCDSRQRPHRLPLSAVHAQETEAAICTRPPKTRRKMLPVLKSLYLTFSISMVRLRIWCPQHENMEPSCLPSGGGGAIGMFSWQTLGHLIPIVL